MKFDKPVIGLEMHVELNTNSKMFCGCPADHFNTPPNSQTCPVCLGLPGALPVPNKKAIESIIMIGTALGCKIAKESKFDRKHYFYPDLAKGYQISQYDQPFCYEGLVQTSEGPVRITRAHMEEDTGKLQHTVVHGENVSLVDFNRGGVPLVEIVTEPDILSATHAREYAKIVAQVIRFLGVSDADMEKGSMRLEANISWGLDLGYKVEVKNINSFNFLAKAIDFELKRQKEILLRGETPIQETRGYNETKGVTFSQRTKEDAADYRYFPEPDIPPIIFSEADIQAITSQMPELPDQVKTRWEKDYKLKQQYYDVLLSTKAMAQYADQSLALAVKATLSPDKVANEIVNTKLDITKVTPKELIEKLQESTNKVSDKGKLSQWVEQAILENPEPVQQYKDGKETVIRFLVGQVMKLSRGKASAPEVLELLKKALA